MRRLICSTLTFVGFLMAASLLAGLFSPLARAQQAASTPVVVQPGEPGCQVKTLPASAKHSLPPISQVDIEFMQGMILHHSQAVEMTALIASHTENQKLRALGAKINISQLDEIKFMQLWLASRGELIPMEMPGMPGMDLSGQAMAPMPGMLTPEQMAALGRVTGAEFDALFLTGMIQHHHGALVMVKALFDKPGTGQNAEIFNFAIDVDNGQRAEIRIMGNMLVERH